MDLPDETGDKGEPGDPGRHHRVDGADLNAGTTRTGQALGFRSRRKPFTVADCA